MCKESSIKYDDDNMFPEAAPDVSANNIGSRAMEFIHRMEAGRLEAERRQRIERIHSLQMRRAARRQQIEWIKRERELTLERFRALEEEEDVFPQRDIHPDSISKFLTFLTSTETPESFESKIPDEDMLILFKIWKRLFKKQQMMEAFSRPAMDIDGEDDESEDEEDSEHEYHSRLLDKLYESMGRVYHLREIKEKKMESEAARNAKA
jgi:hypothetical protein